MRRFLAMVLALGLAGFGVSSAHADESYAELISGISWNREQSEAIVGIAAGHDFDLDETHFVGVELSLEKELVSERHVAAGIGGRFGRTMMSGGKAFVGVNWQTKDCFECGSAFGFNGGWEQDIAEGIYAKIEYKHLLVNHETDKDIVLAGLGVMF